MSFHRELSPPVHIYSLSDDLSVGKPSRTISSGEVRNTWVQRCLRSDSHGSYGSYETSWMLPDSCQASAHD